MEYKTKYQIKKITSLATTVVLYAGIAVGLSACARGCYKDFINEQEVNVLAQKVLDASAGDDRVLDKNEKGQLLRELGITGSVDEAECIGIRGDMFFTVEVYATSGRGNFRSLAYIKRSNLENCLINHEEKTK